MTRRLAVASALLTLSLAAAPACFSNLDGFTGGDGSPGADGSTPPRGDASDDASDDATDRATDANNLPDVSPAGPNLLTNGDFELGCAGWTVSDGTLTESSLARGGAKSCVYCSEEQFYTDVENVRRIDIVEGERYFAEVWLRTEGPTALSNPPELLIYTFETVGGQGNQIGAATGGPPFVSGDWVRLTALLTADRDAKGIAFQLRYTDEPANVGKCVHIDDATMYRLP